MVLPGLNGESLKMSRSNNAGGAKTQLAGDQHLPFEVEFAVSVLGVPWLLDNVHRSTESLLLPGLPEWSRPRARQPHLDGN